MAIRNCQAYRCFLFKVELVYLAGGATLCYSIAIVPEIAADASVASSGIAGKSHREGYTTFINRDSKVNNRFFIYSDLLCFGGSSSSVFHRKGYRKCFFFF